MLADKSWFSLIGEAGIADYSIVIKQLPAFFVKQCVDLLENIE